MITNIVTINMIIINVIVNIIMIRIQTVQYKLCATASKVTLGR